MLPGMSGVLAGIVEDGTFSASYIGNTQDPADLTTYTFSGVDVGSAHSQRDVFVLVNWAAGVTNRTISSATIGGVAATVHRQAGLTDGVSQSIGSGIISAAVPSGTTATIAITFSGLAQLCVIGVVRVVNKTAITDTAIANYTGANPNNPSTNINVGANGALLACVTSSAQADNIVWTGATEQYENTDGNYRYSGALSSGLSLQAARPISTSQTSATQPSGGTLTAVSIN